MAGLEEIRQWVMGMGTEARVLEPESLKELVKAELSGALLNQRIDYAEKDPPRWMKEFRAYNDNPSTAWPYTDKIQDLGRVLRYFKAWVPVLAAFFFVLSLFFDP